MTEVEGKKSLGAVPLVYPIPIALVGTLVNKKPNFAEIGDVGIMGVKPPLVYVSSGKDHYTNKGILKHGAYSINFPSTDLLEKTDFCGIKSGHDTDKSELFDIFYGELKTVPMIRECPVNLVCKVVKTFSIQHREIFVGEVMDAYVNEEFVTEEKGRKKIPDMRKLDPIIYALDNQYYKIGEPIGVGYREGRKVKSDESE